MNSTYRSVVLPLMILVFLATSCSENSTTPNDDQGYNFDAVLTAFSGQVAVATYADLKDKAAALNAAVVAFDAQPTNQTLLDAAGAAWRDARVPWEASEAFLFGPVAFTGLDPKLDSWPVDRNQLDNVLNSSFDLTPEFIADGLGDALKGFHTIEYLLFRDGQVRPAASVTDREREYLIAVTQVLADDTEALWSGWTSDGFAAEFGAAGESGSRYQTQQDAVVEMVEGIIGICDEVANGKIADPFDEQDVTLVESQFSWNSLTDFSNNVRSVQNAYTGGYHLGTDGEGLDVFVREQDSDLDDRIKAQLTDAIAKVGAIPQPFRNNLTANAEIQAAQTSINAVLTLFEDEVKPLINN